MSKSPAPAFGRFVPHPYRQQIGADYIAGVPTKEIMARYKIDSPGTFSRMIRSLGIPPRNPKRAAAIRLAMELKREDQAEALSRSQVEAAKICDPTPEDETPELCKARCVIEDEAFRTALARAHPNLPKGPSREPSTARPRAVLRPIHVRSADRWLWPADCGV